MNVIIVILGATDCNVKVETQLLDIICNICMVNPRLYTLARALYHCHIRIIT